MVLRLCAYLAAFSACVLGWRNDPCDTARGLQVSPEPSDAQMLSTLLGALPALLALGPFAPGASLRRSR